jgi:metallophosphoesterase (TIGR00282 family)
MRILFIGDIFGRPGREIVRRALPALIERESLDFVIANVENAAAGFGITGDIAETILGYGVDAMTTGNHVWDKKEAAALLESEPRLLRPANYPDGNPGRGLHVGETAGGTRVATINLEGQVFMRQLDSPFRSADALLAGLDPAVRVVVVDFHAEATSEKQALGRHLDGRVSAVLGTHTHVPTADERLLPGGTAFQTDVGMTGPYDGVIGFRADRVLERFLMQTPTSFEVAKRDVRLAGALIDVDESTGRATAIERLLIPDGEE